MTAIKMIYLFAAIVWSCTALGCWAYIHHSVCLMRGYSYSAFGPERIPYQGDKDQLIRLRSWVGLWLFASLLMLVIVMYGPGGLM